MHRVIAAILTVTSCASIAQAQSAASPPSTSQSIFTLDRARTIAGGSSPSIESAAAGIRSAAAGRTIAGLRPNPEIQVQTENVAGSGIYRGNDSDACTPDRAWRQAFRTNCRRRFPERARANRCGHRARRSQPADHANLYLGDRRRTTRGRRSPAGRDRRKCFQGSADAGDSRRRCAY